MKIIRTHTFNSKKYIVDFCKSIEGVTDTDKCNGLPEMLILKRRDLRGFHSALHEALEASGFCDNCLHFKNGESRTEDAARFLWRWLKRKKGK